MGLILRRSSLDTNSVQVNALRDCLVEMSEDYPRLTLPVEIVHGTEDRLVPPDVHAIPLSKRIPGAVLTLLPGVGHMPHHADPEAVVAAIDRAAMRAGLR
jgi:pimeloyl-ACP methyl ester carboxylesterase